jgi:hypothetical protein
MKINLIDIDFLQGHGNAGGVELNVEERRGSQSQSLLNYESVSWGKPKSLKMLKVLSILIINTSYVISHFLDKTTIKQLLS